LGLQSVSAASGGDAAAFVRRLVAEATTPELDPVELAATSGGRWSEAELQGALETLAEEGRLELIEKVICPECDRPLDPDDLASRRCPHCDADFRETGEGPKTRTAFRAPGGSRDIEWMVVVHGMNTRGPWQEELSWRLSNKFAYSAPVLIYKYGEVRVGALFGFRHRALVKTLGRRVRSAVYFAQSFGRGPTADVVLHSFGTLLFARLLDDPEFQDLRFGRVILAGSIVRPDHDWARHVRSGRVEAILNHCGGRDSTVKLAPLAIPGSGPSGRQGFSDPEVLNIRAADYDHSTFFEARGLAENLALAGCWDRFLRLPANAFRSETMDVGAAAQWRPPPPIVQKLLLPVSVAVLGVYGLLVGLGVPAWIESLSRRPFMRP
jgi:hypothetical protein